MAVPVVAVLSFYAWQSGVVGGAAGPTLVPATQGLPIVTVTPGPASATPDPMASAGPLPEVTSGTPDIVLPTSTFLPEPSPSPTAITTAAPTQYYTTQSGDTLPALAARFGVNPVDLQAPFGLSGTTTLAHGQTLIVPNVLGEVGPGYRIVPDWDVVYSVAAHGFDPHQFAAELGGYLARYDGFAEGRTRPGGDVIRATGLDHSINPRLLLALLEYQSGWVTNPAPQGEALTYPYGYVHPYLRNLNAQLTWATSQLAIGYYGWRDGTLTTLSFPDGSTLRLNPTLNAGTVALQFFFAQILNRPEWDQAVGEAGLAATYRSLFGDPFARNLEPFIPHSLTQIPLALPFAAGQTWYYTGGPHGAWERGGAQAALDFAPPSTVAGCVPSNAWVTSVAAGVVVRSGFGVVVVDMDGDNRETTGWNIMYLHIADNGRVKVGTWVERGDRIGHPSCEGGRATGTHVHVARKYNGEWIPADSVIPFDLSGWVAGRGKGEYLGTLTRGAEVVEACTCTAAWTAVTAPP